MEMIMLKALEWRMCMAGKAGFVDAFLDVRIPNKKCERMSLGG